MAYKYNPLKEEISFILNAHILNPIWRQRDKRRIVRGVYSWKKAESYLKRYHDFVERLEPEEIKEKDAREEGKIFSIWFQGEENAPRLVKVCFKRLREAYGERYVVLDDKTLWDWIKLPEHIVEKWRKGIITNAHFSDICRVALLYTHGGMWFDATDFLTSKVPQWIEDADLFIYLTGDKITPGKLIQSCFMRARKGHPLLKMLLDFAEEYWKKEDKIIDYFLLHYMLRYLVENNKKAAEYFYKMPQIAQDPTHNIWYDFINEPYSEELYKKATEKTFFQKTTFKWKEAEHPKPGTMADYVVNGRIKGVSPE